jgi:hypothetical protein
MAILLSDFFYFLTFLLDLTALVLILEWVLHFVPGAPLNGVRKLVFNLTFQLLFWSERFFSIRLGSFNSRGLLTAGLLLAVSCLGIPWLIIFSYSLRG